MKNILLGLVLATPLFAGPIYLKGDIKNTLGERVGNASVSLLQQGSGTVSNAVGAWQMGVVSQWSEASLSSSSSSEPSQVKTASKGMYLGIEVRNFQVQLNFSESQSVRIEAFDLLGRRISLFQQIVPAGNYQWPLMHAQSPLRNWNGVAFVRIQAGAQQVVYQVQLSHGKGISASAVSTREYSAQSITVSSPSVALAEQVSTLDTLLFVKLGYASYKLPIGNLSQGYLGTVFMQAIAPQDPDPQPQTALVHAVIQDTAFASFSSHWGLNSLTQLKVGDSLTLCANARKMSRIDSLKIDGVLQNLGSWKEGSGTNASYCKSILAKANNEFWIYASPLQFVMDNSVEVSTPYPWPNLSYVTANGITLWKSITVPKGDRVRLCIKAHDSIAVDSIFVGVDEVGQISFPGVSGLCKAFQADSNLQIRMVTHIKDSIDVNMTIGEGVQLKLLDEVHSESFKKRFREGDTIMVQSSVDWPFRFIDSAQKYQSVWYTKIVVSKENTQFNFPSERVHDLVPVYLPKYTNGDYKCNEQSSGGWRLFSSTDSILCQITEKTNAQVIQSYPADLFQRAFAPDSGIVLDIQWTKPTSVLLHLLPSDTISCSWTSSSESCIRINDTTYSLGFGYRETYLSRSVTFFHRNGEHVQHILINDGARIHIPAVLNRADTNGKVLVTVPTTADIRNVRVEFEGVSSSSSSSSSISSSSGISSSAGIYTWIAKSPFPGLWPLADTASIQQMSEPVQYISMVFTPTNSRTYLRGWRFSNSQFQRESYYSYPYYLRQSETSQSMTIHMPALQLQSGDTVVVEPLIWQNASHVFLEKGNVPAGIWLSMYGATDSVDLLDSAILLPQNSSYSSNLNVQIQGVPNTQVASLIVNDQKPMNFPNVLAFPFDVSQQVDTLIAKVDIELRNLDSIIIHLHSLRTLYQDSLPIVDSIRILEGGKFTLCYDAEKMNPMVIQRIGSIYVQTPQKSGNQWCQVFQAPIYTSNVVAQNKHQEIYFFDDAMYLQVRRILKVKPQVDSIYLMTTDSAKYYHGQEIWENHLAAKACLQNLPTDTSTYYAITDPKGDVQRLWKANPCGAYQYWTYDSISVNLDTVTVLVEKKERKPVVMQLDPQILPWVDSAGFVKQYVYSSYGPVTKSAFNQEGVSTQIWQLDTTSNRDLCIIPNESVGITGIQIGDYSKYKPVLSNWSTGLQYCVKIPFYRNNLSMDTLKITADSVRLPAIRLDTAGLGGEFTMRKRDWTSIVRSHVLHGQEYAIWATLPKNEMMDSIRIGNTTIAATSFDSLKSIAYFTYDSLTMPANSNDTVVITPIVRERKSFAVELDADVLSKVDSAWFKTYPYKATDVKPWFVNAQIEEHASIAMMCLKPKTGWSITSYSLGDTDYGKGSYGDCFFFDDDRNLPGDQGMGKLIFKPQMQAIAAPAN